MYPAGTMEERESNIVPMQRLTSFRIGGRPLFYARPSDYAELRLAIRRCRKRDIPFRILGGGSNVLIDDGSLPFAVIQIRSPGFDWVARTGPHTVRVGAGVRLGRMLSYCRDNALGGLEFLAGIPGTIGGAVVGNAGAWGCAVGERVVRAWTVGECGEARSIPARSMRFGYRCSGLAGLPVTEVELALEPRSPRLIEGLIRRNLERKTARQPTGVLSAGCIFKNPPGAHAGELLDLCGLKGRRIGGAEVSPVHANFICNVGAARAQDVLQLIEIMRQAVRARFKVELELEMNVWLPRQRVA